MGSTMAKAWDLNALISRSSGSGGLLNSSARFMSLFFIWLKSFSFIVSSRGVVFGDSILPRERRMNRERRSDDRRPL